MMHIITGSARGVRLETLAGERTRPTSERAKEAIFSMLQFELEGRRILDLFAGSGQMGLEAVSRGAQSAVLVDCAKEACEIVRKNVAKTRLGARTRVVCADALRFLESCAEPPYHLVFLDPPYASGLLPSVLWALLDKKLLTEGAIVVAECGAEKDLFGGDAALSARYEILKTKRYGVAYVFLLTPAKEKL